MADPNIDPEQLALAAATLIEGVQIPGWDHGIGVVVTDEKFTEDNAEELLRLLAGKSEDKKPRGVVISWEEIPAQSDEGDCQVNTTYGFTVVMFWPFGVGTAELTSTRLFKRMIFWINEKLNANIDLGFGDLVRHKCLQSSGPFDFCEWGKAPVGGMSHYSENDLDIVVENYY